ncbi:MAG TPA: glycosyltransferase family 2 protein [Parvibaculum sp.]|jgi:glycosyltransferase involved in cell wall biosynthesis
MKHNSGGPKITVVIPTRERADVFASALRTVTTQDYDNLEILVSDNLSGDATEEIARNTGDPRVRYLNTGKRLSMSHNWEFALSHVTGDWVTIVGDDDGLLPSALRNVAEFMRASDALAIQSATCKYRWPGNNGKGYGHIRVPMRQGHEIRSSKRWMEKVLRGRANYIELPILYTGGFARMTLLHELKRKTGAFYKSRIPDVYSGFAIASLIPTYAFSHAPFAISGISKHSTGVDAYSKGDKSAQSPAQKFALEENMPFHKDVPLMAQGGLPPSPQALIFESFLQTAELREGGPIEPFDRQLAVILANSPPDDETLHNWASAFARMHGFDYERARFRSHLDRLKRKLAAMPRNLARNRRRLGSAAELIPNVYDASLAVAAILGEGRRW